VPKSKSEVRRRLDEILAAHTKKLIKAEIERLEEEINLILNGGELLLYQIVNREPTGLEKYQKGKINALQDQISHLKDKIKE